MNIGDIISTKWWGDVEILSNYTGEDRYGKTFNIKFLNTGNLKHSRESALKTGCVEDTEYKLQGGKKVGFNQREISKQTQISIGDIYKSISWGDVKILSIYSTKKVEIEFVDTGNTYFAQKHAILGGLVSDSLQAAYITAKENSRLVISIKVFKSVFKYLSKLSRDKEDVIKAERSRVLKEDYEMRRHQLGVLTREEKRLDNIKRMEEIHTSTYGGNYNIVKFLDDRTLNIMFHESGFVINIKRSAIGRNIIDTSIFSKKDLQREYAANYYENNKESFIAQATKWQKDNPDAVQVRNNKRRAREIKSGGSYTKEEASKLFEDQDGFCAGCNADLSFEKHLDHIMPLALGGSNSIENLQWLCPFCNLSKNAKHPDVWLKEIQTEAWKIRRNNRKTT